MFSFKSILKQSFKAGANSDNSERLILIGSEFSYMR